MLSRHAVTRWRRAGWVVAAVAAIRLGTLAAAQPTPPAGATHAIRYRLAWRWGRAVRTPDGGWEVVTDLGYRVHVRRGYLTSYSMELVECPPLAPLSGLFGPTSAYAWHSADMTNPATVRSAPIESLLAPRAQDAGTVRLPPQAYCQVHYLVARATTASRGLPADVDMVDSSLDVEGTVQRDGAPPTTLVVKTASPNALLRPIARVDSGRQDTLVVLRRDLGQLFDGIDFDTTRLPVVENRIVENLVNGTRVKVRRDTRAMVRVD